MQPIISLLLITTLAVVVIQDFKSRMISWYLVPLLLVLFTGRALIATTLSEAASGFMINVIFIFVQLLVLTFYFSVRQKKLVNIIDTWLGMGDVLLFIVFCAAFSPVNYFIFYLTSLVLTIAGFGIYKAFKGRSNTIPLAGTMSVAMIILLCYQLILDSAESYDDMAALNFIMKH